MTRKKTFKLNGKTINLLVDIDKNEVRETEIKPAYTQKYSRLEGYDSLADVGLSLYFRNSKTGEFKQCHEKLVSNGPGRMPSFPVDLESCEPVSKEEIEDLILHELELDAEEKF